MFQEMEDKGMKSSSRWYSYSFLSCVKSAWTLAFMNFYPIFIMDVTS